MKKILAGLILLISTIAVAAAIDDLRLTSRGDGGKIVIEPKDNGGTKVITLEADGQNATITIPNGVTLKVNNLTNIAGTDAPTGTIPVGTILPFAGATPPTGFLLCNGGNLDSVTNTQYAPLFSVISTTYGGTGASSFSVPDFTTNNKFPRMAGGSVALGTEQVDATAVNGIESAHNHPSKTLSVGCTANQSSHSHIPQAGYVDRPTAVHYAHAGSDAGYVFSTTNRATYVGFTLKGTDPAISCSSSGSVDLASITSLTTGDTETRPYSIAVNYIIKY